MIDKGTHHPDHTSSHQVSSHDITSTSPGSQQTKSSVPAWWYSRARCILWI